MQSGPVSLPVCYLAKDLAGSQLSLGYEGDELAMPSRNLILRYTMADPIAVDSTFILA